MGTKQRRGYLGHLFLRVKLNDYDCTVCKSKEDYETIRKYAKHCLVLDLVYCCTIHLLAQSCYR
jgi:hypothetical protein